jgi:hypothetical protein
MNILNGCVVLVAVVLIYIYFLKLHQRARCKIGRPTHFFEPICQPEVTKGDFTMVAEDSRAQYKANNKLYYRNNPPVVETNPHEFSRLLAGNKPISRAI